MFACVWEAWPVVLLVRALECPVPDGTQSSQEGPHAPSSTCPGHGPGCRMGL